MRTAILLLVFLALSSCQHYVQPEKIIIPASVDRKFAIVYGIKDGVVPKIEDGRLVEEIPENGVLLLSIPFDAGIINQKYFLRDSLGNLTEIYELYDIPRNVAKQSGVMLISTATLDDKITFDRYYFFHKGEIVDTIGIWDDSQFDDKVRNIAGSR